ncbi:hypothetical protein [Phytohabitans aurantiacus]|uniref:DUF4179 domain-containing protein n=1 Tax=Phytohabitans aurantiacus TaxID=3016789 RepID=A0ABQ5R5R4_9ACTN|nr:hypothetical protein [Phytohabitans aurantiacus]GLI01280.1 hypothetical protein Pa4123_65560 [Phytohabitans aurantiacus]
MTMNDTDVRAVLHRATDHLASPDGLVEGVRRGGRRRVARRRLLAAGLAVVTAGSIAGVLQFSGTGGERIDVASRLFDEATRGDLARDQAFLRDVREVWRRATELDDLRGEPHVVWAGNTPKGKAAYVTQRTMENPVVVQPGDGRLLGYGAFVVPTAKGPRILTLEQLYGSGYVDGNSQAVFLGPDRDTLLVLDFGRPVEYSPSMSYAPDGRIVRQHLPVTFRDGAASLPVPPQRTKVTVAVGRAPLSRDTRIHIVNESEILFPGGEDRGEPKRYDYVLPGADLAWGAAVDPTKRPLGAVVAFEPFIDIVGTHAVNPEAPSLSVFGGTPDGRRLLIETIQYDDDPGHAVAILGRGESEYTVVVTQSVDWTEPLPVRLRLPDGQGTLVAAPEAKLEYRAAVGAWQDAGRGAALVPVGAIEVRVTPASGVARTARL